MKNLLKKYNKNIEFFKIYNNKLYKKLIALEEQLQISQRYFLEYNENYKCFNIFDEKEQKYLLQQNSLYDAKYKAFQIDNSIKQSISLIQTKKIEFQKSFDYKLDSYQFINQYIEKINFNNLRLKKYKFIFFGTILGEDIKMIIKKIKSPSILFYEENIELFRLTLFIVPYYKYAKKTKLYFSIDEINFDKFYKNNFEYNHFIKYHSVNNSYIDKFTNFISLNNPLMYTFSEYLGSYKRGFSYINNGIDFLQFNNSLKNSNILFLGAGPSLEKEIEFIKNHKNKFIIIALGATLKLLYKYNIKPHCIITIDGSTKIEYQFSNLPKNYLKNIPIILSLSTHKNIIKHFTNNPKYFIQTNSVFIKTLPNFTGYSAGDIGLDIILKLNPNSIYLLGFDLALYNNKTHISTHNGTLKEELEKTIYTKGNFTQQVQTIKRFLQIKLSFENILKKYNKKNIYNLSYGLEILYTKPLKTNNIVIDKNAKKIILKSKTIKKLKKNNMILKNTLQQYNKLLKPYSTLLKLQEKDDKLKNKQIKTIKSYYEQI